MRRLLALLVLTALLGAACGDDEEAAVPTTEGSALVGEITVFAAASLTDAFNALGDAFTEQHPDAKATFNFGASSDLVTAITENPGTVDVFASADQANMEKITNAGLGAGEPSLFASNTLQIIVGAGNPKGIETVEDLAAADLLFVTCAPEVPIGTYTQQLFTNAGVTVTPKSLEENVKGIVARVTAGEADAGVVYATDVIAAGEDAEGVEIPEDINVPAHYPISLVADGPEAEVAAAFVAFVLSDAGQAILAEFGFGAP